MSSSWLRSRLVFVLVAALAVLVLGCGQDDVEEGKEPAGGGVIGAGQSPGATIRPGLFRGARFTVGSKEFTEQLVLGQIAAEALRAGGAQVNDGTGIQGTEATRRALTSGDIDMYWEYTGTAQTTFLDIPPTSDPQKQYEEVARADRANGVEWLQAAPANNAFGIATRLEAIRSLDVRTLSDLAALARRSPQDARLCAAGEFLNREDGLPGVERAYGLNLASNQIVEMGLGDVYAAIDRGNRCNFGEVFLTDGRITANELFVLEDDKSFFTSYNPCLNVRSEVLRNNPKLKDLFDQIAARLDSGTLRQLNAQVDVGGSSPQDVARQFLDDNGFTG